MYSLIAIAASSLLLHLSTLLRGDYCEETIPQLVGSDGERLALSRRSRAG